MNIDLHIMYTAIVAFEAEKVLMEAQEELKTKIQRRVELDREIWALRRIISGLIQVTEKGANRPHYFGPGGIHQGGLTSACKTIVRMAERALSPMDIREQLELSGYDFVKLSNPLSAIHTVLKRLVLKGELRYSPNQVATLYEWVDEQFPRNDIQDTGE